MSKSNASPKKLFGCRVRTLISLSVVAVLLGIVLCGLTLVFMPKAPSATEPRASTATPRPTVERTAPATSIPASGMSLGDCIEYVVDEVLWVDAPAYIFVCIDTKIGDKQECTKKTREILTEVARTWCLENR